MYTVNLSLQINIPTQTQALALLTHFTASCCNLFILQIRLNFPKFPYVTFCNTFKTVKIKTNRKKCRNLRQKTVGKPSKMWVEVMRFVLPHPSILGTVVMPQSQFV